MKYQEEVLMRLMSCVQNLCLFAITGWVVVSLYDLSQSWHSLWALAILLCSSHSKCIRA